MLNDRLQLGEIGVLPPLPPPPPTDELVVVALVVLGAAASTAGAAVLVVVVAWAIVVVAPDSMADCTMAGLKVTVLMVTAVANTACKATWSPLKA